MVLTDAQLLQASGGLAQCVGQASSHAVADATLAKLQPLESTWLGEQRAQGPQGCTVPARCQLVFRQPQLFYFGRRNLWHNELWSESCVVALAQSSAPSPQSHACTHQTDCKEGTTTCDHRAPSSHPCVNSMPHIPVARQVHKGDVLAWSRDSVRAQSP